MTHQNETLPVAVARLDNARTNTSEAMARQLAVEGVRIERPSPGRPQPKSRAEG